MTEFHGPFGELPYIPDDLTIPQFILDHSHPTRPINRPNAPWFIEESTGRKVGFEEIRVRTFGFANALKSRWNIGEDDVVCLFSPNHVDYATALWAIHRLGAIVTPPNPAYTVDELTYQITATKAKLLITHSGSLQTALDAAKASGLPTSHIVILDSALSNAQYPTLDALVHEGLSKPSAFVERKLEPGEARTKLALLSFSSGTTGRPKAVAIPHFALIANVIQTAIQTKVNSPGEQNLFRPGDLMYAVLPFYHIYGIVVNLHWAVYSGFTLVVAQKFNFIQFLKSIQHYRINHLLLVPPMVVLLCKSPEVKKYDLSSIRFIMSGAAPLSAELTLQVVKTLPNTAIGQAFGTTETCSTVTFPRTDQKVGTLGSTGQLMPGVVARVVKEDGTLAKLGEPGEFVVKTPAIALGYLNNEKATKETFVDGWVRTGDVVVIKEEAMVFVVDRIKEIMKVKGFQVAPAELEGHLLNHPDVSDTCVVGIPDEYSGEVPLAFVTLSQDAQARVKKDPLEGDKIKASIVKHVADHKVHYKRLAGGVEFIDSIPKNPSGKLLRRFLRDKAQELVKSRNAGKSTKAKL